MDAIDAIVVGGGPAGLSATLYLARYRRRTVLLDGGHGRWGYHQRNRNYLGFPDGVTARELRRLGRCQVEAYPEAEVLDGVEVAGATRAGEAFTITAEDGRTWSAPAVVVCTGVDDDFPDVPGADELVGRSLFWCLACDGYELAGRRVLVSGAGAHAAAEAVQLVRYAAAVTLVRDATALAPDVEAALADAGVAVHGAPVVALDTPEGRLRGMRLADGTELGVDAWFHAGHPRPRSAVAAALGARCDGDGWVAVSTEQRTSAPGVYAAGDVTRLHSHQIATAVHEGAQAASAVNADLTAGVLGPG